MSKNGLKMSNCCDLLGIKSNLKVWKEKLSIKKEFLLIIKCLICINTRRFSYAYTIFKYCGIKQAIKKIIWKLRKNVPIFHFFKLTALHMRDLKLKEELELIILRKISKKLYEKFRNYFIFEKQFDWGVLVEKLYYMNLPYLTILTPKNVNG
ncbi:hypothetical protein BpHYR1_012012 [Brachionus plicatilis]|uniref:Uncharacterized protein n=1 Tax=Brachionus plicatilis TaxID=10195 RepID=A0A3M7SIG8_BRAPC|nr:hypothetical protein BpHYR1_012012 [Brachionus plicatilis]